MPLFNSTWNIPKWIFRDVNNKKDPYQKTFKRRYSGSKNARKKLELTEHPHATNKLRKPVKPLVEK